MAMMTGFGLFLVAVLTAVLSRIFADEITAWSPSLGPGLLLPACIPLQQILRYHEFRAPTHSRSAPPIRHSVINLY